MPQDVLARAIAKAGTQEALAELIGQKRNAISNWKAGRPIPDEVLAFLADYVGEDPIRVLGREKGGLWRRLGAGVAAAVVVATISPGQANALPEQGAQARLYIMSNRLRGILRQLWRANLVRLRTTAPHQRHMLAS